MASTDRGGEGRLGIYVDTPYEVVDTAQGARIRVDPADFAFMLFACEVGRRFASCTVIGRANPRPGTATDCLLPAGTRLVALPYYRNLRQLREVARAASGTLTGFWRGLGG